MGIIGLNSEDYQQVVERLIVLSENANGANYLSAGLEYTSLMICFLLHNTVSDKSLLRLRDSLSNNWFPATVGYAIVRPMLEVDITSHYITQSPVERSHQYINIESILNK